MFCAELEKTKTGREAKMRNTNFAAVSKKNVNGRNFIANLLI
jgi:hypothetical protein